MPRYSTLAGGVLAALLFSVSLGGCSCEEQSRLPDAELQDPVTGLTPAEAEEVLVTVGETKITLGDFAATLLRMDRFERLRFQTEERQKELLDEMVEIELLAQEARRRGLHEKPEVKLRLHQSLRDEVLRDLEKKLPSLESFSEREVRNYYDSHRDEFKEPERRRVLVLRIARKEVAEEALAEAKGASGQKWAELTAKYSLDYMSGPKPEAPELSGDLGFVSAVSEKRGENELISEAIRKAIFKTEKVGDVAPEVVETGGDYFVVRLGGLSPARDRNVKDAERTIRVELRRQKFLQAEKDLEAELRKKYPVKIDEGAIASHISAASTEKETQDGSPQK